VIAVTLMENETRDRALGIFDKLDAVSVRARYEDRLRIDYQWKFLRIRAHLQE
jgi:hypothetical protein